MANIILNRVRLSDGDELIRCNCESREYHAPWVQPFTDKPGFEAWFARTVNGLNVSFLARAMESNEIAGVVNVSEIVMGAFKSAYLGYYGMLGTGGRGLMTEAVRLAVESAFSELGLHRVEANIQPGNNASIALVQRLGFRREGFSPGYLFIAGAWRDHERWALLSDEVRAFQESR